MLNFIWDLLLKRMHMVYLRPEGKPQVMSVVIVA